MMEIVNYSVYKENMRQIVSIITGMLIIILRLLPGHNLRTGQDRYLKQLIYLDNAENVPLVILQATRIDGITHNIGMIISPVGLRLLCRMIG